METEKIEIEPFLMSLAVIFFTEAGTTLFALFISGGIKNQMVMLGIIRAVEIILLLAVFFIWGNGLASIGLARSQIYSGFIEGLLWSLAFGMIVLIGFGIIALWSKNPLKLIHTRLPRPFWELISFFFVGGIIAPIAEEIFFRGILYGFLRRWGIFTALFGSTLIFAALHSVRGIPLTQMIGGILFAVAYETEEKLMVPITIHISGNIAIFMISLLK